ncbi:MAG: hypothetical protein ABSC48_18170 [Terracidiphilus sp.]|jgi:hypothetical protein
MPKLDQIRAEKLIQLARERFDPKLKRSELKVLRDSASSEDLPDPGEKVPRPEVRADFLRWLATDPEAAPYIDPKGLRVYGVTLPGNANLRGCCIGVLLYFRSCTLEGDLILNSAETKGIYLWDCSVKGAVSARRVETHGPIYLPGTRISGGLWLRNARITGDLYCSGTTLEPENGDALSADGIEIGGGVILHKGFTSSGTIRLIGARIKGDLECSGAKLEVKEKNAMVADRSEIGGSAYLNKGFMSTGKIRLLGARIRGTLDCSGAKLEVKEGDALLADGAEIGGSVFLDEGFASIGTILLHRAEIGGHLDFRGAMVTQVNCRNLRLAGDFLWMGIRKSQKTSLDLLGARVKNLRDDKESWPEEGKLDIDWLVYEELTIHEPSSDEDIKARRYTRELPLVARERIDWILLQGPDRRTEPQPWMQLRDLLERKGDRKGAKYVLRRFRYLQAQESWILWRWARKLFALLEENPLRILWSIAFTLLIGTSIFAWAGSKQAMIETVRLQPAMIRSYEEAKTDSPVPNKPVSDHYPHFQPFVYTLENAVPLIKFGMDEKWAPDPRPELCQPWFPGWPWRYFLSTYAVLSFTRWMLIVWGWAQATILAASLVDRFKK